MWSLETRLEPPVYVELIVDKDEYVYVKIIVLDLATRVKLKQFSRNKTIEPDNKNGLLPPENPRIVKDAYMSIHSAFDKVHLSIRATKTLEELIEERKYVPPFLDEPSNVGFKWGAVSNL